MDSENTPINAQLLQNLAELEEFSNEISQCSLQSSFQEEEISMSTQIQKDHTRQEETKKERPTFAKNQKNQKPVVQASSTKQKKEQQQTAVAVAPKKKQQSINESQSELISERSVDQLYKVPRGAKNNHFPQIIDEDTENFKIRLEHLLNVFKSDAIGEFMSMKKSMLEVQDQEIKSGTDKYLQMYNNINEELDNTKQELAMQLKKNKNQNTTVEAMGMMIFEIKNRMFNHKIMWKYLNAWKTYKLKNKLKFKLESIARQNYIKRLMKLGFSNLHSNFLNNKLQKQEQTLSRRYESEIESITFKFNKEISSLKENLNSVQTALNQSNQEKDSIQDNLKKAFMRGVCAMNFEAQNIFTGYLFLQKLTNFFKVKDGNTSELIEQTTNLSNQVNLIHDNLSQIQEPEKQISIQSTQNTLLNSSTFNLTQEPQNQQKKVVFFQQPKVHFQQKYLIVQKIESKDHRWRDAPIVGFEDEINSENQNRDLMFKKTNVVNQDESYSQDNCLQEITNIQQNSSVIYSGKQIDACPLPSNTLKMGKVEEGKVIKVNNGKSFIANKQKQQLEQTKGNPKVKSFYFFYFLQTIINKGKANLKK